MPERALKARSVTLLLSIRETVYLDHLVSFGLHGISRQEVVKTFMRRGLQDAMSAGFFERQ
jgi:hypothetical protein